MRAYFCREQSCDELAKEFDSYTLNKGMMANPDVESSPLMDLYVSPQSYDPGSPAHAEGTVVGVGCRRESDLGRQALVRQVGPQHVLQLDHVRGGLDVVEVERGDPVDVLEDPRELPGHRLDLLVAEAEPGQLGDVENLLALDHGGDSRRLGS